MKSWSWVLLIVLSILIKWASWYPELVEKNYSQTVFPRIAKVQRFLFGWVPFSIGDIFYGFLSLVIIFKTYQLVKNIIRKQLTRRYIISGMQQIIFFFLFVYVFFNLLWGLNYNRQGIAYQLQLEVKPYTLKDLDTLTSVILDRTNYYAGLVAEPQRDSFNKKKILFTSSYEAFLSLRKKYNFFNYQPKSIKPSLYSYLGNYFGFQGYYNPFSGEGQVNTTIPRFLEPFVTTHEIAHQLGYAKESEANFVGFLACHNYPSPIFQYSLYFDLYNYAISEVYLRDTILAKSFQEKRHPQLVKDVKELRKFYKQYDNPIQELVMWGYGHFLKANNQPGGKRSYNEVVAWLIAYYKKFGINEL